MKIVLYGSNEIIPIETIWYLVLLDPSFSGCLKSLKQKRFSFLMGNFWIIDYIRLLFRGNKGNLISLYVK